ncbi:MAG: Carbamoyltransferase [Betaproteobacteria bacterium]|nr:Carbamoyltransferase [Betaproteobacteria bacterium]
MTMITLGINAVYHDSSATLVRDGNVIAAAEEERFTHIKHAKRPVPFSTWELPFHAINYCLAEAGVTLADVDHVAYSYEPALLSGKAPPLHAIGASRQVSDDPKATPWTPLFTHYIQNARGQLHDGAPHHLQSRLRLHDGRRPQWHYVEHHLAHEASAFLASPFDECAVLTMDGRGELATTSYGAYRGGAYKRLAEVHLPHSLGLLYEEVTEYLGFLRSSDEYKVMALASYGEPAHADAFRRILRFQEDGQYRVGELELVKRFGPPRTPGAPMTQRDFDLARSLQLVLEETVLSMAQWLHKQSGMRKLALAGGVALNCVLNAYLRDHGPFDEVWAQPAAGDAGTSLGAALWIDHRERGSPPRHWRMAHAYLGPGYSDDEIETFLKWSKLPYRRLANVAEETADLLAQDRVIGWFQGRMEFGPRALGARSILASPLDARMQARLNEIKDREDFRPVAPVVLEENAGEWFEGAGVAPFMLFVFDVARGKEDRIPAVRHVDGTARVQTINREQHPLYYDLIAAFQRRTGVPVLINTSFNTRGEPIVCTPRDAIESFWTSPLDALVIGSFLLEKSAAAQDAHA